MTPKTGTEPRHEAPAKLECRSMTGYALARAEHAGWAIRISVKSVNHRFLDIKLRMPDSLEPYDLRLRQAVKNRIHRGHVDIHLNVEPGEAAPVHVNRELLQAYLRAADELRQQTGAKAELDIVSLLRLPGVIGGLAPALPDADEEQEALGKALETCLAEALAKLDEMRHRRAAPDGRTPGARGANWRAGGTGARAGEHAAAGVRAAAGIAAKGIAERRSGGFRATGAGSGAAGGTQRYERGTGQLRPPPAAVSQKLLDGAGELGKKLDFLLQEMHREANTMLSKTPGVESEALMITSLALEIKEDIEKLREQSPGALE